VNLGPPPADPDEQETPVAEEFGRLAFEGVADKLKNPSQNEETEGVRPKSMDEDAADKDWEGEQDGRNAERVADPVHWMLVA